MAADRQLAVILATNLKRLMDHNELSQNQLAQLSGVAQRTLSTILDVERPLEMNPRSTTIQQLADYFQVAGWQLLIPDMPVELLTSPRLAKLIEHYRDLSEVGRANVERIAELELRLTGDKLFSKAG